MDKEVLAMSKQNKITFFDRISGILTRMKDTDKHKGLAPNYHSLVRNQKVLSLYNIVGFSLDFSIFPLNTLQNDFSYLKTGLVYFVPICLMDLVPYTPATLPL